MTTPRQLKILYEQGKNITELLRKEKGLQHNTDEIIEIAYDLQSGAYIASMEDREIAKYNHNYTKEIARTILSLCEPETVLEAGVGEATTLAGVLNYFNPDLKSFGFDLSWSRLAYARKWLESQSKSNTTLCTGNLFHIPFADNAIDVVYTSHSIEPNGGNEEPILKELFRVTRKFLVLLEPSYELADSEARKRMDSHGYCKNLKGIADCLGYKVLQHKLFPYTANPLNPTAMTIIQKVENAAPPTCILACPSFKTPLVELGNMLFSREALVVYPIIDEIPCLRISNGILASKFEDIIQTSRVCST